MDESSEEQAQLAASEYDESDGQEWQDLDTIYPGQLLPPEASLACHHNDSLIGEQPSQEQRLCTTCRESNSNKDNRSVFYCQSCSKPFLAREDKVEGTAVERSTSSSSGSPMTESMEIGAPNCFTARTEVIRRSEALHRELAKNPPPGDGPWWSGYSERASVDFPPTDALPMEPFTTRRTALHLPSQAGNTPEASTSRAPLLDLDSNPSPPPDLLLAAPAPTRANSASPPPSLTGPPALHHREQHSPTDIAPPPRSSVVSAYVPVGTELYRLVEAAEERRLIKQREIRELTSSDPVKWQKRWGTGSGAPIGPRAHPTVQRQVDRALESGNGDFADRRGQDRRQGNREPARAKKHCCETGHGFFCCLPVLRGACCSCS